MTRQCAAAVVIVLALALPAASLRAAPAADNAAPAMQDSRPRVSLPVTNWYSLNGPSGKPAALYPPPAAESFDYLTVYGRRQNALEQAWRASETPGDLENSARNLFNVDGDLLAAPANCQAGYTTVAGQPASPADLGGPIGVSGCYY